MENCFNVNDAWKESYMSGIYTTDNSWLEEVDFSDEEQRCKALDARDAESFNGMLGIRFAEQSPDRTVACLLYTSRCV